MRRTVIASLLVAFAMTGIAVGTVAAFDAVGGPSDRPRTATSQKDRTEGIGAQSVPAPNASDPASVPPPADPGAAPAEEPTTSSSRPVADPDGHATTTDHGPLSDAFAELGLDDPTTGVDESLPTPCTGLLTSENPVACVLR